MRILALAISIGLPLHSWAQEPKTPDAYAKWEKEIAGMEKKLQETPPAKGGIVFSGSSSIKLWDVKKSFPELNVINVGFGGSIIPENTHFAPRLVIPLAPETIVFYAGDNDVARKRTPEEIKNDFAQYVKVVRAKLPKVKILFVAIKPSPKRWEMYEQQTAANKLVREYCEKGDNLVYVDIVPLMLGADKKPIPELFVKDELHISAKGYEVWTDAIKKVLKPSKP